MAESLTFVEIDIPVCTLTYGVAPCTASLVSSPPTGTSKCFNTVKTCQDRANTTEATRVLRFAISTEYLPKDIEAIPSIESVSFTPATISLGENLGTRATLSVTFKDHPHSDTPGDTYDKYLAERSYDPYWQGSYWGKFRARQPYIRGRSIRWITGLVGQSLAEMETRHFFVESFDGPGPDGKFTIIGKDLLKFADGDRAQAPVLSNGYLVADITASTTSATLSPSGIGNLEYPSAGFACIGGKEVVLFTRSGDALTITRGQKGSTASTHKAQDRVQLALGFTGADAGNIIWNLLTTYAGIDPAYIDLVAWNGETADFLGNVYTGIVCEPTSVATLCAEIIKQAGLSVWWDEINEKLRLKVLRGIVTDVAIFTPQNYVAESLTIKDQPERRISRCQVYFGQVDPTKPLSNFDNFRSTSVVIDEQAEIDYGTPVLETIVSRWIPEGGRAVADRLASIRLGRFRDPPRRLQFRTMRYAGTDIDLGIGYRVEADSVQDASGAQAQIPIQVTRLNRAADFFNAEAEEMLFTAPDDDLANRLIILDANAYNKNLRTLHDALYPAAVSGDVVTCRIETGVVIGSGNTSLPALDIGSWPSGVIINVVILGRLQGRAGAGGNGGVQTGVTNGTAGLPGGPALYTRYPINLDVVDGEIWSGAGGGGGGGAASPFYVAGSNGGGGGGGAGEGGGLGGLGVTPAAIGGTGTQTIGGDGGNPNTDYGGRGGDGGGPGLSGSAGAASPVAISPGAGGAGGAAGLSIDGISFVTVTAGPGDIRGTTAN